MLCPIACSSLEVGFLIFKVVMEKLRIQGTNTTEFAVYGDPPYVVEFLDQLFAEVNTPAAGVSDMLQHFISRESARPAKERSRRVVGVPFFQMAMHVCW